MSFVHCHACNWQQDDFWSLGGYNPLRYFVKNAIPTWSKPEMVRMDSSFMPKSPLAWRLGFAKVRMVPFHNDGKIKQVFATSAGTEIPAPSMVREHMVFSWYMLAHEFASWCRKLHSQKWWTYESWRKAVRQGKGGCPVCNHSLCID